MKQARRLLSILLTLVMVLGVLSAGASVFAANGERIVRFGNYPQSEVTDAKLIGNLADVQKHWNSYNYYSGTGTWNDGRMTASDYMRYADFTYGGQAYRAVQALKYRPSHTGAVASATAGNGSGYATDFIYYFKYEPIEWMVLSEGNGILMSKKLLDAQAYQNVVTANGKLSYENSSIRSFLTNDFLNTAFTAAQKSAMKPFDRKTAAYGASTTGKVSDYVSLLTYDEAIKGTGTVLAGSTACNFKTSIYSDANRVARDSTAYAKCQGLNVAGGATDWWLLNPSEAAAKACCVDTSGALGHTSNANLTNKGVRPIICLPTLADNTDLSISGCSHNGGKTNYPAVKPTCTTPGHDAYVVCNLCSAVISGSSTLIPAIGHVDEVSRNGDKGGDGWCDVCGEELMVHLDNSGSLQLDGPLKNLFDMIRRLVQKLEGLFAKLKADKTEDTKKTEDTQTPASTDKDVDLSETGKTFDAFADLLGTLINSFKGFSDEKSAEKEADRADFWQNFTDSFNNG